MTGSAATANPSSSGPSDTRTQPSYVSGGRAMDPASGQYGQWGSDSGSRTTGTQNQSYGATTGGASNVNTSKLSTSGKSSESLSANSYSMPPKQAHAASDALNSSSTSASQKSSKWW